jgi:hypothetical protein
MSRHPIALLVPNSWPAGVLASKRSSADRIRTDSTMTLLDRIRTRRRRTLALVTATAIALLGVAGPSPATAAKTPPATPETSDSAGPLGLELGTQPGSEAKRHGPSGDASGGFIYHDGRYTPLDTVDGQVTAHVAINNRGQTAGTYFRSLDPLDPSGFVRSREGRYTTFDIAPGPSTLLLDINDRGTTVGLSGDTATGEEHEEYAFRRRSNGDVTTIDVPGARSSQPRSASTTAAQWLGTTRTPTEWIARS